MSAPRREKRDVSGWIVLDKPLGMTSTEAVGKLRWLFGAKKAGHAGTLDPLATGILPIAFGEATKAVPVVQDGTKLYRFSIVWGAATATDDREGEVIATSDVRPDTTALEAVLPSFIGAIAQVPPQFSALKIDGERAYDLARAGESVLLAPRIVDIDSLKIVSHSATETVLDAACGKGTYVRSLARDIAEALGTRGHVGQLERCAVGAFTLARAISVAELEALDRDGRDSKLLPVAAGLADWPELRLSPHEAQTLRFGNPVLLTGAGAPLAMDFAWASCKGMAVALGSVEFGQFKPSRVFAGG